jgi:superfamily II DNA/RNA helicase
MYLHRIGRTGRAGATGVAVTLAVWNELARLEMIKRALQIDDETHEVFSTSPLLDELFGPLPTRALAPARAEETASDAQDEPPAPVRSRPGRRSRRTRRKRRPETLGTEVAPRTTPRDDVAAEVLEEHVSRDNAGDDGEPAPVVEPISPASRSARGRGKPTRKRPLEISYLP